MSEVRVMSEKKRTIRDYPSLLREQAHCGFEAKPAEAGSDATGDQENAGNAGSGNDIAGGEEEMIYGHTNFDKPEESANVHIPYQPPTRFELRREGGVYEIVFKFAELMDVFEFQERYLKEGK